MLFVYIKTFRKTKLVLVYKFKLQWLPSAKYNMHIYIYIQKAKKLRNVFIYKKPDTFQKARQFALRVYIQKARHFTSRNFSWNFWNWYLYTKSMTLCVTWYFYIQKTDTSQEARQFALRFIHKKSDALRYAIFHGIFEIGRVGGIFICKKKQLALYFYMQRKCTFHYVLHI